MFLKKLFIIIAALFVLAAGFMFLRSFGMLKLVKNVNSQKELPEAKSPEIPVNTDFEKYLIISNIKIENSIKTEEHLKAVLDYMKKDYQTMTIEQQVQNLSIYDCIFLTIERLDSLKNLSDYIDYVKTGGKLVFLTRPVTDKSFEGISSLLGIKDYDKNVSNTKGIKVLSDVMIGANGFESNADDMLNSSKNLELVSGTMPLLTSYTGVPLLWEQNYQKGFHSF